MSKTLKSLAKKYNGFVAPAFSVEINNTDLSQKFIIKDFRLELTAGYEASGLSFSVINGFSVGEGGVSSLNSKLEGLIKLGNVTEASIGYGSEKTKLFLGYIDSVYIDYSGGEGFAIAVECLDAKGIMMNSLRSQVKKDIKRYSEAVKSILDGYPKLITKQTVERGQETSMIEQHNESDYEFVVRAAKKTNCSFYIVNGETVFAPVKKQSPVLKIEKSDLIRTFSARMSLKGRVSGVNVRSGNELEPSKPFEGKAGAYRSVADGSEVSVSNPSVIPGNTIQTYIDHSVSSPEEAKASAEARITRLSRFWAEGRLECTGAPELIPGKTIEVEGFGGPCDRKYYIKKAAHIIGVNGYVTQCELGADTT